MQLTKEQKSHWIFEILCGRKAEELSSQDVFVRIEAKGLQRCVEGVEFEQEISKNYAETMLKNNYYVGINVYKYIQTHYSRKRRVKLRFQKNEYPVIRCDFSVGGVISISIPIMEE